MELWLQRVVRHQHDSAGESRPDEGAAAAAVVDGGGRGVAGEAAREDGALDGGIGEWRYRRSVGRGDDEVRGRARVRVACMAWSLGAHLDEVGDE